MSVAPVRCLRPPEPVDPPTGVRRADLAAPAVLVALSVLVACYDVAGSGPAWPDAPRYANGAAMIHDWLASGDLGHPYRFALANYARYPAFSIPYHPPVYPGLLGAFFLVTGVSYTAARVFIGFCLGAAVSVFYATVRRQGIGPGASLGCALLLMTFPEVVVWSRDTMSEIPALAFILAASCLFWKWLEASRPAHAWAAFGLAELAFLCRVTSAGVLPAWFLYATLTGRFRRLFSPHVVVASALYLSVNLSYLSFAARFSKFETTANPTLGGVGRFTWDNVAYYPAHLPAMIGWAGLAAAAAGAACTVRAPRRGSGAFWSCWLLSYSGFQWVVATNEQRYFLFALPGACGLAASLFGPGAPGIVRRRLAPALLAMAVGCNTVQAGSTPRGLVGYDAVARGLVNLKAPGNVMLACLYFQDLVFRVRSHQPQPPRYLLRSDRTLAIRLSPYTGVTPDVVARSVEDVEGFVRRGRVRYLVTCAPVDPKHDDRAEEMVLAHEAARSSPDAFAGVSVSPLLVEFGGRGQGHRYQVYVWEYRRTLPDGPSDLPVVIPTAGLDYK